MNIGDDLRHQFVRLSYSPEIMSMEFTREEMITIYDYIKSKEEEIEKLNKENKELNKICARKSHYIDKKDLEIGILNNIIKEVRDNIDKKLSIHSQYVDYDFGVELLKQELLEILDKVGVDKE